MARKEQELTIVLTGFGPFLFHRNNPSEEVVRRIAEQGISEMLPSAKLICRVIPVAYDEVQCMLCELWQKHHPDLVVHLGVHSPDRCVRIETRSCGTGYYQEDIKSQTPRDYRCPLVVEKESTLCCGLNCEQLLDEVKTKFTGEDVKIELSDDPGRYLCAYSYYISLRHNKDCCLFVHIPEFDESCTVELITRIVKHIILASTRQILKARNEHLKCLRDEKKAEVQRREKERSSDGL